jgi:hypothetical protein
VSRVAPENLLKSNLKSLTVRNPDYMLLGAPEYPTIRLGLGKQSGVRCFLLVRAVIYSIHFLWREVVS